VEAASVPELDRVHPLPMPRKLRFQHLTDESGPFLAHAIERFLAEGDREYVSVSYAVGADRPPNGAQHHAILTYYTSED
jgi:hypothetical protein